MTRAQSPPPAPSVIIFRRRLLPWSETFIASQGLALSTYHPVFAGFNLVEAGPDYLDGADRVLLEDHHLLPPVGKVMVKKLGRVPGRWARALARRRPVLVHAHFGHNALDAAPLAARFGIPLVVTFHGADITAGGEGGRTRQRRAFSVADRVVAVSDFIRDRVVDAGCPPERVVVHYIGVDTEAFHPGPFEARDEATILFVGRLVEKKGLAHLIRAMPHVVSGAPAAELVVVGDGPLRQEMEALARSLDAPVRFLGVRPPDEVAERMRTASVLCAPSIVAENGDAEGLGMVNVEAQASGLPVVLFPTGGAGEAVAHGETGFHAQPGDDGALAEHLLALLTDTELRRRFGEAARERVLDRFDLARQSAALEEIYDEVRRQASVPGG